MKATAVSEKYVCAKCGKVFDSDLSLHQHQIATTHSGLNTSSPVWVCKCCFRSFRKEVDLQQHHAAMKHFGYTRSSTVWFCSVCEREYGRELCISQHKCVPTPPLPSQPLYGASRDTNSCASPLFRTATQNQCVVSKTTLIPASAVSLTSLAFLPPSQKVKLADLSDPQRLAYSEYLKTQSDHKQSFMSITDWLKSRWEYLPTSTKRLSKDQLLSNSVDSWSSLPTPLIKNPQVSGKSQSGSSNSCSETMSVATSTYTSVKNPSPPTISYSQALLNPKDPAPCAPSPSKAVFPKKMGGIEMYIEQLKEKRESIQEFNCAQCSRKFNSESALLQHQNTVNHSGQRVTPDVLVYSYAMPSTPLTSTASPLPKNSNSPSQNNLSLTAADTNRIVLDETQLENRRKKICLVYDTDSYGHYQRVIPRDRRTSEDPQTPLLGQLCSKSQFNKQIISWRLALKKYQPDKTSEVTSVVTPVKESNNAVVIPSLSCSLFSTTSAHHPMEIVVAPSTPLQHSPSLSPLRPCVIPTRKANTGIGHRNRKTEDASNTPPTVLHPTHTITTNEMGPHCQEPRPQQSRFLMLCGQARPCMELILRSKPSPYCSTKLLVKWLVAVALFLLTMLLTRGIRNSLRSALSVGRLRKQ